jgi:hypothetical protein
MALYVDEIAKKAGMSRASVRRVMNAQLEVCADTLANGEGVNLLGVGISPIPPEGDNDQIYRATVGKRLRRMVNERMGRSK